MEANIASFENTDKLHLAGFCDRLQRYLMVDSAYVDESLVVSLDAEFGAGKTTFIKMWANRLLEQRSKKTAEGFSPMPIMLNAWESDYAGDPLVAILGDLMEAVDDWVGADKPSNAPTLKQRAIEAVKDIGWFATGLANGLATSGANLVGLDGLDPSKAGEFAQKRKDERKPKTPDFIQCYQDRKSSLKGLRLALSEAFGGSPPKVIVFVDELDRCRPDYAVSFLETIKHVFDVKGMVFVLAMNREQFACSVEAAFGVKNFPEYMRKFVHRSVRLPKITEQGSRKLFQDLSQRYWEQPGLRTLRVDHQRWRVDELLWKLGLSPRQWLEVFRLVGYALESPPELGIGKDSRWAMGAATVLLAALSVKVPSLLIDLVGQSNHTFSVELIVPILTQRFDSDDVEWWIQVCLAGESKDVGHIKRAFGKLSELGYCIPAEHKLGDDFSRGWPERGFAFGKNQLILVAERILQAATFAENFDQ